MSTKLKHIIEELLDEKEDVFVPRVSPEERKKRRAIEVQKEIQQYIKDGSKGHLHIKDELIKELPSNLKYVGGELVIKNTPIESLPDGLTVETELYLVNTNIKKLPKNLTVKSRLNLAINDDDPFIKDGIELPENLTIKSLILPQLKDRVIITSVHPSARVDAIIGDIDVKASRLPSDLSIVRGSVYIDDTNISEISSKEKFEVVGKLVISNSTVNKLPDNLHVGTNLTIANSTIKSFGKTIVVNDSFSISNNKNINEIPSNVSALSVEAFNTNISSAPNNLNAQSLWISKTPLAEKYTNIARKKFPTKWIGDIEKEAVNMIKAEIERKNGSVKNIYI